MLLLLLVTTIIVESFSQYASYPYNYGYPNSYNTRTYPVSNQYYYQPPCQSSCGNPRPVYTSSCQRLPCQLQQQQQQLPYYTPYPYYGTYGGYNTRRVVNPYPNIYQNSRTSPSSDPYAGVPVEIIDDDNVFPGKLQTYPVRTNNQRTIGQYADVPVQIIDVDPAEFWKNVPRLPKVTKSSHSNYSVSQGAVTSNTVSESKPVRAVITRTFQPLKPNPEIKLDFLNGEPVNTDGEGTTEAAVTTTEVVTTTEESEAVEPVKSWF